MFAPGIQLKHAVYQNKVCDYAHFWWTFIDSGGEYEVLANAADSGFDYRFLKIGCFHNNVSRTIIFTDGDAVNYTGTLTFNTSIRAFPRIFDVGFTIAQGASLYATISGLSGTMLFYFSYAKVPV